MSTRVRIAFLSDPHIEIPPERVRPGTWQRLLRDRRNVNTLNADLVTVTGDLTTFGSSDVAHLEFARGWLAGFSADVMAIPGNHDLGPSPDRATANPEMEAFEPVPFHATRYGTTMRHDPVQVVDLGCVMVYGISLREDDPDGVLPALAAYMAMETRPMVLCGHYPVVNPRPGYTAPEFGSADFVPRSTQRLLDLILESRHPILYLCGHAHVNAMTRIGDRHHQLTAGGLGPGSSTFRVLDVDEQGVAFSTHLGSGPLLTWAYPDGVHSAEFSLGQPEERSGFIPWAPN